jgi:hypothetical protein
VDTLWPEWFPLTQERQELFVVFAKRLCPFCVHRFLGFSSLRVFFLNVDFWLIENTM